MSYDYDALVAKALAFRRRAIHSESNATYCDNQNEPSSELELSRLDACQGSMATFDELSRHCPMTPLLWIQYGATAFDYCQELAKDTAGKDKEGSGSDPQDAAAAATPTSMETQLQILQLGLQEFPGSLLLHLRYVYLTDQKRQLPQILPQPQGDELTSSIEQAIQQVGRGSYTADGELIVSHLYTRLANIYASQKKGDALYNLIVLDQSRRPLPNDGISSLYRTLCKEHKLVPNQGHADEVIDQSRRLVAKLYNGMIQLQHLETDIQSLLHANQLMPPWNCLNENSTTTNEQEAEFWKFVAAKSLKKNVSFGMGYGGLELAQAFVTFATARWQLQSSLNEEGVKSNDEAKWKQMLHDGAELPTAIYERGVAECPTVELIWISYLDHIESLVRKFCEQQDEDGATKLLSSPLPQHQLVSVSQRACRNCPYSLSLAERQLHVQGFLAEQSFLVLDPDKLYQEMVRPALASKFLPADSATGVLYLAVLRIIQRRILWLLTSVSPGLTSFDVELDPAKDNKLGLYPQSIPDDVWTEIQDLCQDWIDMCTAMEEDLAKLNTKAAAMTRSILFDQRAVTMEHIVQPLLSSSPRTSVVSLEEDEVLRFLHKAATLQNPSHPDTQLAYIRHFFLRTTATVPVINPVDVVIRLCHVRFLCQRAVTLSGNTNSANAIFLRDYHTAFKQLADEWVQFETQFGSQDSVLRAQRRVDRKFGKFSTEGNIIHPNPEEAEKIEDKRVNNPSIKQDRSKEEPDRLRKRRHDATDSSEPSVQNAKKAKTFPKHSPWNSAREEDADEKQSEAHYPDDSLPDLGVAEKASDSKRGHVVKVGDLKYPAHPFTVRVSNLGEEVQDMDLVDLFQNSKSACGKLVHVRVLRERKGKSKGCGLVQFEERDAVERALKLDGIVGLHERTIGVQRSHAPAVPSIVPPGMHRVNPQGEGKATKRNLRRKTHPHHSPGGTIEASKQDGSQGEQRVLSLVPRAIAKKYTVKEKSSMMAKTGSNNI